MIAELAKLDVHPWTLPARRLLPLVPAAAGDGRGGGREGRLARRGRAGAGKRVQRDPERDRLHALQRGADERRRAEAAPADAGVTGRSASLRPVEDHAAMVEDAVDEHAVGGEAGVVPVEDLVAGDLVAALIGALARAARLVIAPVRQQPVADAAVGGDPEADIGMTARAAVVVCVSGFISERPSWGKASVEASSRAAAERRGRANCMARLLTPRSGGRRSR